MTTNFGFSSLHFFSLLLLNLPWLIFFPSFIWNLCQGRKWPWRHQTFVPLSHYSLIRLRLYECVLVWHSILLFPSLFAFFRTFTLGITIQSVGFFLFFSAKNIKKLLNSLRQTLEDRRQKLKQSTNVQTVKKLDEKTTCKRFSFSFSFFFFAFFHFSVKEKRNWNPENKEERRDCTFHKRIQKTKLKKRKKEWERE